MSRRFGTLCSNFIGRVDKTSYEDGTEGSDSSAHKIQTPGDYQKKKYNVLNMAKVWNQALLLLPYNDWGEVLVQLVEALRYKSEGRGFDSRWCHWNFSLI
jgi:hypothetical protein